MSITVFPVVVLVVGILLWAVSIRSANPGIAPEAGRLMFACGLLALCFALAGHTVSLR